MLLSNLRSLSAFGWITCINETIENIKVDAMNSPHAYIRFTSKITIFFVYDVREYDFYDHSKSLERGYTANVIQNATALQRSAHLVFCTNIRWRKTLLWLFFFYVTVASVQVLLSLPRSKATWRERIFARTLVQAKIFMSLVVDKSEQLRTHEKIVETKSFRLKLLRQGVTELSCRRAL